MNIHIVGKARDGALLGQDEDGALYRGTTVQAGWDLVERQVQPEGDSWRLTFSYQGQVVANETVIEEPDAYVPKKMYRTVNVERDGVETTEQRELLVTITQWEAV